MNDRPNDLIKIRPILNLKKSSQISDEESFQNDTLRPIIKLQSPLLIETYKNYIDKHKNVFYDLSNEKKLDYIENSINKNKRHTSRNQKTNATIPFTRKCKNLALWRH